MHFFSTPHRHLSLDEKSPALKQPLFKTTSKPSKFCNLTEHGCQAQSIIITTSKDRKDCCDNNQWPVGLHSTIAMITKSCAFTLDAFEKKIDNTCQKQLVSAFTISWQLPWQPCCPAYRHPLVSSDNLVGHLVCPLLSTSSHCTRCVFPSSPAWLLPRPYPPASS